MVFGYAFSVTHYQRALPGLQAPLRVAHLSDLHIGFFIRAGSVRRWVEAALAEGPDLVVITGDITDSADEDLVAAGLAELGRLRASLGVWAVLGNHDYRYSGYAPKHPGRRVNRLNPPKVPLEPPVGLERRLADLGIGVLNNRGLWLRPDLYLAGVEDLWHGEPDVERALSGWRGNSAALLLCHNPDYLYQVPSSVGLTLCGHTHGGQVVLPGYGPAFTSSLYGQQFAAGWVEAPVPAFISRGLGMATLPVRVACPAELAVHRLVPL
ncbi:metallophosphoesterase [Meiothermus sp. QL-1]|uniref:metallophosphoesterase n=1 Tax=Meiothermus sp. QL-1 TaxID=2058095 RepID=UPI000E0B7EEB|nr:metallophosphoesterase [Meiothermus sp. QL-1]RDI94815.1 metallophosphoesterase [Meiothermus sp. QL-1]